jgi:hypothetical protein
VNKTAGGKVSKRRTFSVLNSNGSKFFRELLHFIGNCQGLEILTFESVDISVTMAGSLGRILGDNCHGKYSFFFQNFSIIISFLNNCYNDG